MPLSIGDMRLALATIEAGTTSSPPIRKAFQYAPTLPTPLPCFVNFIDHGNYVTPRIGQGIREGEHRVRAVALVALQADSADAERTAESIIEAFVHRLDQHKTLDGTAGVIEASVESYEYGPVTLQQDQQPFLGVSFDVRINTVEEGVTYASSG